MATMTDYFPNEKEYVISLIECRYEDAKRYVVEAICAAKKVKAPDTHIFLNGLIQCLGNALFHQGDKLTAIALYEISEYLDPDSLYPKLAYARFLLNSMNDKSSAIEKAKGIIAVASSSPFVRSDDDFSSDEYIKAAKDIIQQADLMPRPDEFSSEVFE